MSDSPIFARTYDLLKWLLEATRSFPRSQRFVLALRLQETAFALQEDLIAAAVRADPAPQLETADVNLAQLRYYLRLAVDMHWLTVAQYEHASRMVDEIGRMLGGWRRKLREQRPAGISA